MKNNLDFPTTKQYTKKDIKKVQDRLLEMAKIVTNILDKNNIKYMISFGTLLGAVRHKGFIPWDDDFDLFLFGDEYEKALICLKHELPKDMIVHNKENDPIYWPYWSRIRDLNTDTYAKLWPNDNKYKYRGINLDLYKLDKILAKDKDINLLRHHLNYQKRIYKSGLISLKKYIFNKIKLYPKILKAKFNSIGIKNKDNIYFFVIVFHDMKYNDIFPLKKYRFEGNDFWGPSNYNVFLKKVYGNYMDIPPYKQRLSHYDWVKYIKKSDEFENNSN